MKRSVMHHRAVFALCLLLCTFAATGPVHAVGFSQQVSPDAPAQGGITPWFTQLSLIQQVHIVVLFHDVLTLPTP